ncbi:MAG: pyridoxine 5'-phosphate synthase [Desulfobulbaceae bacterium A2]|nr:MAG: pyridoxine 5'-phosphate synthase [Desulfobulbaceae bacterium A2]
MPVNLQLRHPTPGPLCLELLRQRAERLLQLEHRPRAEFSLVLIDDDEMTQANGTWRQRPEPTNVLSFPADTEPLPGVRKTGEELGDILISLDSARREARELGRTPHQHLTRLLVHGFLHLLGLDHERSDEEAATMLAREEDLCGRLCTWRTFSMTTLAVNVDHVATVRQARGSSEPDPVFAAGICELAGASGIVVHLREDRRHIQDRDVRLLRQTVKTMLNLEMATAKEIVELALELGPDLVTLVPEKRQELTTEGGLDLAANAKKIAGTITRMSAAGIPVSLFINPDEEQVQRAHDLGAACVELHTGRYCDAPDAVSREAEFALLAMAAEQAYDLDLRVHAGHGLDYRNVRPVAELETISELSIGHAIIARAVLVGLDQAVREMLALVRGQARPVV